MPFITHDLRVESATQRYTRLDVRTYRFESLTSGWISNITFDDDGLVIDYDRLVRRLHPRNPSTRHSS